MERYEDDPRKREANALVDEFIKQLEACLSYEEKRQKVWELVFGIQRAATRKERRDEQNKDIPSASFREYGCTGNR